VRDLNRTYRSERALHARDTEVAGFRWIVGNDEAQSIFAFLRLGDDGDPPVLAVVNMTPIARHGYRIGVPAGGLWREILNTDAAVYGGSNLGNAGMVVADEVGSHGEPASLVLTLPPLATLYLRRA
jgi:1,4-alpha-glucan branching enzyme